jgi:hypothetical protein
MGTPNPDNDEEGGHFVEVEVKGGAAVTLSP